MHHDDLSGGRWSHVMDVNVPVRDVWDDVRDVRVVMVVSDMVCYVGSVTSMLCLVVLRMSTGLRGEREREREREIEKNFSDLERGPEGRER